MSTKEEMDNILDYFFVCGIPRNLDPLPPAKVKTVNNGISVKPALLEHYPETVPGNPWEASVRDLGALTQLCHPGGLSICREKPKDADASFHSFLLTRQDGFRTYGHALVYYEDVSDIETKKKLQEALGPKPDDTRNECVYAQKSICLFTRCAYINTCEKILRHLHKMFVSDKNIISTRLPIESYLFTMLFEMPAPSPGNSLALMWDSENPIILHRPSIMEIPLIDVHLSALFSFLGSPINVIRLLTSAFLEHQILLISKDCRKLIVVAEAIISLMFPFQWPHTYVPVLPYNIALNFLDAPVPYIMGIMLDSSDEEHVHFIAKFDQCFVDIDKNLVVCPEGQPNFPNQTALVQQLSKVVSRHVRQMNTLANDGALREELEGPADLEEVTGPSPPMQRRNAQKRQSRLLKEDSIVADGDQPTGDAETAVDESLEDMKNLHAVSIPPAKPEEIQPVSDLKSIKPDRQELQEQIFNIKAREIILGSLVSLFSQYDKFVIHPEVSERDAIDSWYLTRETQQNFDKASFLSDQPEYHLRFLSAFLETQMFASLIDNRIVSQLDASTKDPHLMLFDDRIKQAKSMPRPEAISAHQENVTPDMPPTVDFLSRSLSTISAGQSAKQSIDKWIKNSESAFIRRFTNISGRYPRIRSLECEENIKPQDSKKTTDSSIFPCIVHPSLLQKGRKNPKQKVVQSSTPAPDMNWQQIQETRKKLLRQPSMSEFSPEVIAQTNWKFLEKLLKDVKMKTKKLLVRKMGQEAVELGHTESSIMGLEENTLIGSLCDLLERIWCHGLHASHKTGKSALWSHLLKFVEDSTRILQIPKHMLVNTSEGSRLVSLGHHTKSMSSLNSTPAQPARLSPQLIRRQNDQSHFDRRLSQPVTTSDGQYIFPISTDMIDNIKLIQQLKEVQTDVGKCRAWIRLALEQKQLQAHLKKLLSNRPLLQTMYKRYSLLRCDDEREQFLYHLLSLNAVEFSCFTNSFTKTFITYRVWVFPKKQLSGISQTSANVHIIISGELACTSKISVPKGCTEFSFEHQNLGVLTTMVLGHDNAGLLPKWLVDFVVIRNEVTGQAYYLPCGRWLGRGVDDGSTQRLLLALSVPRTKDINQFIYECISGKNQSVSSLRKANTAHDILEKVGQAVNAIVKYFHRPLQERLCLAAITTLLCKPNGLIPALIQTFQHGLRSSGFFRKQAFAWDVVTAACQTMLGKFVTVKQELPLYKSTLSNLGDIIRNVSPQRTLAIKEKTPSPVTSGRSSPQLTGRDDDGPVSSSEASEHASVASKRLLELHELISRMQLDQGWGKDDMFQLLVCVGLREHTLPHWFKTISTTVKHSTQLYEPDAVMCNPHSINFLTRVLNNLSEYSIEYEPILMRGLDRHLGK